MRILSDFKDYYDYLAWQYGVDNQIIFHRNSRQLLPGEYRFLHVPDCEDPRSDIIPKNEKLPFHFGSTNPYYYENEGKICQFEFVSILGEVYWYLYEYDKGKRTGAYRIPKKADYINYGVWREKHKMRNWGHFSWLEYWAGIDKRSGIDIERMGVVPQKYSNDLLDISLHKKLGMPIIWKQLIDDDRKITMLQPQLSLITGFSGLYPPEKLYRDIYNFLQALRSIPDAAPPVALENESRIQKAGFDLKYSFRREPGQKKPRRKKGRK